MSEVTVPSGSATTAPPPNPTFLEEVMAATPGHCRLNMCIQCGSCGGSCPAGQEMDHTPRGLFAMMRAGMVNEVLRSNTPWFCISCYFCTVRCPQQIHITDVMYTLKSMAIARGLYREHTPSHFSLTFVDYVEQYGRSFELGLATRFNLRHHPLSLPSLAPMGLGMLKRGRLEFTPRRIEGMEQLSRILERAKDLEARP